MIVQRLRTTSFRLPAEYFGRVFVYRAGSRFKNAWERLKARLWPEGKKYYRLPDTSLRAALTVMSGDFVGLEAWRWLRSDWALVSRRRIGTEDLQRAFTAWEMVISGEQAQHSEIGDSVDDLQIDEFAIAEFLGRRPGRCPSPEVEWIWTAATWEVAHRLATESLHIDQGRTVALRLDSEARLLTWDDLLRGGRTGSAAAMHVITPRLITIPGLEDPVIHLQSSLTRLASTGGGWLKSAWIDQGVDVPVLHASICRRQVDGDWRSFWDDDAPEVLRRCKLRPLPEPDDSLLAKYDAIRGGQSSAPPGFPIGTGTGQMFHEAVALHARRCLPDACPVELVRQCDELEPRSKDALSVDCIDAALAALNTQGLHLTVLYGNSEARTRFARAIESKLQLPKDYFDDVEDGVEREFGRVRIVFRSPPDAVARLMGEVSREGLPAWAVSALGNRPVQGRMIRAALIETGDPDDLRQTDRDPKHIIRRTLAAEGIVCQFMSTRDTEGEGSNANEYEELDEPQDHAAENAVMDILRSAGIFPDPFTTARVESGTWLVGVYVVKRRQDKKTGYYPKKHEGYVVSLVAVKAGGHEAQGYVCGQGWRPHHEATAKFLANAQNMTELAARQAVESALEQLAARNPGVKLAIFMDAARCRTMWKGLTDTVSDTALPPVVNTGRAGIVRVRSIEKEVPRVGGAGQWPATLTAGPGKPRTTNGLFRIDGDDWPGAMFYASTSQTMSRQGRHRDGTRFTTRGLARNWHALTMTEFWSPHPGPFAADALYELASVLCRQAPTWCATLERPSPLHLARAVVLDHPDRYETRDGDTGDVDEAT